MEWVYLTGAIVIEIASTLALRVASAGRRRWYVGVVVGYAVSFVFLSFALDAGHGARLRVRGLDRGRRRPDRELSKVLFDEP